jgi:uncharacterized integral membrane protein (TIGR00698 family)
VTVANAKKAAFIALALACLAPFVTAPIALVAGTFFSLAAGNPLPAQTKQWQTWLLQASVVGLGAGMNLLVVAKVGSRGVGITLAGLTVTILLSLAMARVLKTERTTSLLIGVGTAICGGSAIAAVAPAVGAKSHQTSVSLAVVFLLNAAALLLFPAVGHQLHLGPEQFGLWSALAIHDTSSVVGAATLFGPVALAVGTTVKLVRALWIIPLTLVLSRAWKHGQAGAAGEPRRPWFILGFVAVAAFVTFVPGMKAVGESVAAGARRVLVLTLFLVGAGVSRDALRQVGARPLVLGVLLWLVVASGTLAAILLGVLEVPAPS